MITKSPFPLWSLAVYRKDTTGISTALAPSILCHLSSAEQEAGNTVSF